MPAVHITEAERSGAEQWLSRQHEAFGLPGPVVGLLNALRRECPVRRGLKQETGELVHVARAER